MTKTKQKGREGAPYLLTWLRGERGPDGHGSKESAAAGGFALPSCTVVPNCTVLKTKKSQQKSNVTPSREQLLPRCHCSRRRCVPRCRSPAAVKLAEEIKFTNKKRSGTGRKLPTYSPGGGLGRGEPTGTAAALSTSKNQQERPNEREAGGGHVPYSPGLVERGADGPACRTAEAFGIF